MIGQDPCDTYMCIWERVSFIYFSRWVGGWHISVKIDRYALDTVVILIIIITIVIIIMCFVGVGPDWVVSGRAPETNRSGGCCGHCFAGPMRQSEIVRMPSRSQCPSRFVN